MRAPRSPPLGRRSFFVLRLAFANDELIGATVLITGGTGVGQARVITDYVGSTDTATVDTWTTTPSGTITYKIFATPPASATAVPAVNLVQVGGLDHGCLGARHERRGDPCGYRHDARQRSSTRLTISLIRKWPRSWPTRTSCRPTGRTVGDSDLLLDGAASAGDPWTTSIPGAYSAGTAGYIVGNNLNAPVGTVDTVVDAIKVKTDQLTFTAANKIDANILNVNSQDIGATKPYDTAT